MENKQWVIKKEISVGDIVAFITAAIAVATAYFTLDKRIALLEVSRDAQIQVDKVQDAERLVMKTEILERLGRMESKIDTLTERIWRRQ